MNLTFKSNLETLIESLLTPKNLVLKKINGKELIGSEMKQYMEQYFKLFQSDNLPEILSIYEATVEGQIMLIVDECYEKYKELLYGNKQFVLAHNQIPIFHEAAKNQALVMYKDAKKMGNDEHEEKYEKVLKDLMEKAYVEWSDFTTRNVNLLLEEQKKVEEAVKEKDKAIQDQLKTVEEVKAQLKESLDNNDSVKAEINKMRLEMEQQRLDLQAAEKARDKAMADAVKNSLPPPNNNHLPCRQTK